MKAFFLKVLAVMVGSVMLMTAVSPVAMAADPPADLYLAIEAKPGLTIYFSVNGGTKNNRVDLFHSPGEGIAKPNADGWYVQKLPRGFDTSQMKIWCGSVMKPSDLFAKGAGVCSKWGSHKIPKDGVFRLKLKL